MGRCASEPASAGGTIDTATATATAATTAAATTTATATTNIHQQVDLDASGLGHRIPPAAYRNRSGTWLSKCSDSQAERCQFG